MDAFFAAVEQRDNPDLRGKPLLVGHDGPRGVVAAASYEARVFGCRSAQPMAVARRLCPQAIIVPGRFATYRQASDHMFHLLDAVSPLVEPVSIDEAFVDLTGMQRLLGEPADVAHGLRRRIRDELRLTASVGIAPNKFLAKLASDLHKPDGLTIIRQEDVERILPPLPVSRLWGVGNVTAEKLATLGVRTIGNLQHKPLDWLQRFFGNDAEHFHRLCRGIDDRPVVTDREAKSIGHEQTFEQDLIDPAEVRRVLMEQVEQVGYRLRRQQRRARGVSLKIRFGKFQTISRSATLPAATDLTADLWLAAERLFNAWMFQPVRLIGMTAERLVNGEGQLELFDDPVRRKQRTLDAVTDRINRRFGKRSIHRGGAD